MKRAKKYKAGVNALCEKWLEEMKQEEIEKNGPTSYKALSFGKALKSLKACPISIATIDELKQLDHIAEKTCSILKKKMKEHEKNSSPPAPPVPARILDNFDDSEDEDNSGNKRPRLNQGPRERRPRAPKPYVPKEGTAPHALLVALYENTENVNYGNPTFMYKDELIREAQKIFDRPMVGTATEHYAGWNSMTTLIQKNLVIKRSSPAKYSLTDAGVALAMSLIEARDNLGALPSTSSSSSNHVNHNNSGAGYDYSNSTSQSSKKKPSATVTSSSVVKDSDVQQPSTSSLNTEPAESVKADVCLEPNSFDVVLLVDLQERMTGTTSVLKEQKINFETRKLNLGDFMWVARCRVTKKELVIPFIIERKRIDDLDSSIVTGRFEEQKFRLRKCGIDNLIYIIENFGTKHQGMLALTALFQAGVNLIAQDNFIVKHTNNHKETMLYISSLTTMLIKIYEGKGLSNYNKFGTENLVEFNEFNKVSAKTTNFTVREMLLRQLVQLNGMSPEKAIAIAEFYPTPRLLSEALKEAGDTLLAEIFVEAVNEKIGPVISKTLHRFYTTRDFFEAQPVC